MSSFHYPRLQGSHFIRLVQLEGGKFSDDIVCSMIQADLDENPSYTAISYAWGDPTLCCPITLEGHRVNITLSLATGLRRLRHETDTIAVWADALCINQEDVEERNQEVLIMKNIYRQAKLVAVYLGEEDDDTRRAFDLMASLFMLSQVYKDDPVMQQANIDMGYWHGKSDTIPHVSDPAWDALQKFYNRDYFNRVWIVQEVALASSEPRVICGELKTWWKEIADVGTLYHARGIRGSRGPDRSWMASYLGSIRSLVQTNRTDMSLNLIQLLRQTWRCKASDPRDKVFALLGIVNDFGDGDPMDLRADYGRGTEECFRDAASFIIVRTRSLDLLSLAGTFYPRRFSDLPTWVPDWSVAPDALPLNNGLGVSGYAADSGIPGVFAISPDRRQLHVGGIPVDSVDWTSHVFGENYFSLMPEFRQPGALRQLWDLVLEKLGHEYSLGGSMVEAFWRTLIANKDSRHLPVTEAYYVHFLAFWRLMRLVDDEAERFLKQGNSVQDVTDPGLLRAARVKSSRWDFTNKYQREAQKRHFEKSLFAQGVQCSANSPTGGGASECRHCQLFASPDFEEKWMPYLHPLREDDPSLDWTDDPFIEEWLHRLRNDIEDPISMCESCANDYSMGLSEGLHRRLFIVTKTGFIGVAPPNTQSGDVVAIVAGSPVPMILRSKVDDSLPESQQPQYTVVGEAYVQGIMNGPTQTLANQISENGLLEYTTFCLV